MTPQEYVDFNDFKSLTNKELKKGKNSLRIYNTDEPMPWTEVYTYIAAGRSMLDIAEKYGHGRKIALWAIHDNIQYIPAINDAFIGEIEQRKKMDAISQTNPVVAKTMLEMVNEYAPNVGRDVALLSADIVKRAKAIINNDDCSSSDLLNIANAIQKTTDTVELTQRFSSGISIGHATITPAGFDFVLDVPEVSSDIIDIEDN